ncbi:endonuclease III [Sulfurospirillum sp. MES]|uniref:endonuclease III n=1 Tax=Sulfurospirillum sp. MES TaxID=1565314 RepID=UPI0005443696|nr:endonuclease III [Sulfurospirillum sp. MES]KHG34249.1 MAG: endonuclease III [Sulfurospirillum sp. MES]
MKKAAAKEVQAIKAFFLEHYAQAVTELRYNSLYELLVCVMLSAQCTDKRVNIITPELFKHYPDVQVLASADLENVKALIRSCSFFNNKAQNLIKMAQTVVQTYGGEIPLDETQLVTLAGVGQKTAHVVMIEYAKANLMAVDTHVFRVAHRLGLSNAKTAVKTEEELTKLFKNDLDTLHQAMVLFGRYHCKAIKPLCDTCLLQPYCKSKDGFKAV